MLIVGLTGSIGMGKTTTAEMFRGAGLPVHDADLAVHRLYSGRAIGPVRRLFPKAVRDGVVDRALLAERVLGDPAALAALEAAVHPMVRHEEALFLRDADRAGYRAAVLDIPLLLESGSADRVDVIAVVSADPSLQRARVLARAGMTENRLAAISARQMPDVEKRRHAHFVIWTNTMASARFGVDALLRSLAGAC